MKSFLSICGVAVLVFLGGAMIEEWDVFAGPWFANKPAAPVMSDDDRRKASNAVYLYLKLTSHLAGTGGDQRFADRIPASDTLVGETLAGIEYFARHQMIEEPLLERLEIVDVLSAGKGRAEVTTREFWVVRRFLVGGTSTLEVRSGIVRNVYRVALERDRWIVVAWDPDDSPEPPKGTPR